MQIPGLPPPAVPDRLRDAAVALEASFLSEMLGAAGFGESRSAFGGGIGEEQFASMLRREHAQALAEAGGIGLAESIYNALKENDHDRS